MSTIPDVVVAAARDAPRVPALAGGNDHLDYGELWSRVLTLARGLIGSGVEVGDRVALWTSNGVPGAVAHYAVLCTGAAVVPLNARYTSSEVTTVVSRAGARLLITDTPLDANEKALAGVQTVALRAPTVGTMEPLDVVLDRARRCAPEVVERRVEDLGPDDISHVQYTSGTTGVPKGAMLRHGAMVESTKAWVDVVGLARGDRYPIVAPLGHIAGHKTGLLASAVAHATAFPLASLDVDALATHAASGRNPVLQGPPTMFHALLERASAAPVRGSLAVKVAVTGAASVPPILLRRMATELGAGSVVTAYGLTEASGVCTMTRRTDPLEVVAETSGRPIPGVELRIERNRHDARGSDAGEVLVRGPGVMAGYLGDPVGTAAAVDPDGWLHTGDIGRVDGHGNLQILDRAKEVVIVGGLNVYPAEVERVLAEHPDVLEVAVVAAPDARLGEVPVAFVVPSGPAFDAGGLLHWGGRRLARFKLPRRVQTVDRLPANAAGKIDKGALRRAATPDTGH